MNMIHDKRGVVFTIIAIVLAVFFTLIFSARVEKPLDYKTEILETRISVLSDYMNAFFDYAEGTASIAGYAALQGVISDISTYHRYYDQSDEFETNYTYCIKTGNLTTSKYCPNMTNSTLTYFLDQLRNIAEDELNINSNYTINHVSVNQTTDAFSVEVILNLSMKVNDAYANISDTRVLTSSVPIAGLLDPLYLLNGTYNQTINPYKNELGNWAYVDLQQLYNTHAYRRYSEGVSFINRIKGDFSPGDDYGIESFVNYTHPGVTYDYNDTMVDYLFWQNKEFNCLPTTISSEVLGINDTANFPLKNGVQYFQLDKDHASIFLSGYLLTSPCP